VDLDFSLRISGFVAGLVQFLGLAGWFATGDVSRSEWAEEAAEKVLEVVVSKRKTSGAEARPLYLRPFGTRPIHWMGSPVVP
jgi:hypothetical protein